MSSVIKVITSKEKLLFMPERYMYINKVKGTLLQFSFQNRWIFTLHYSSCQLHIEFLINCYKKKITDFQQWSKNHQSLFLYRTLSMNKNSDLAKWEC